MANLNDFNINISLQTKAMTVQGFALPLILGKRPTSDPVDPLVGKYTYYSELEQMTSDGFTSEDSEYKMAALMFAQSPRPEKIAVFIRDENDTIPDTLNSLVESHNDWYILLITERDIDSNHAAGNWMLGREKMFAGCSADSAVLNNRNNIREFYLIHDKASTEFPESAWVGVAIPQDIGSITWKWQTPTGVTASNFTFSKLTEIRENNGQTLCERSGYVYTNEGITTGGEFIDTVMARDLVKARLSEGLFSLLIKNKKISFTDSGLAKIEAKMREVFDELGSQGVIATAESEEDKEKSDSGKYMYTVSVPERSEVSENDRAKRHVPGITFTFTLSGATHTINIEGTIEV